MGGDQKGPSIWLKIEYNNKQGALIPNMALKVVYGYQIKSYEQIEFENLKFYGRFPRRKSASKNDGHKKPLLEAQIEESFQKNILSKKNDFRLKNMKKTESPKMVSKRL